ncbi:23S rRNA (uracil(1939)-C(5))-methyltransferase RlmD [Candidatus Uhrbacteria bacterium]|nr:23S rRNA (uracil(1939)-C(5))-methyltransferase RlmD [Candidatus Uhrbacteria bacterium]
MKFGDTLNGKITGLDDKGRGMFEDRVIPFTFPGDEVEAAFVKRDKGMKIARLTKITSPSSDRVDAPCPHAGVCGGCLWQQLSYDAQLRLKQDMLQKTFEQPVIVQPSTEQFFFRNRMDYVFGWKGELGLKEYGSWNRYVDIKECLLLDKETPSILETIRGLMRDLKLEPWDAKKYTGDLRYTVIRLGKNTSERMIILLVKDFARLAPFHEQIKTALAPLCTTLYLGENPEITDVSYAKSFILLHGNEYLTEEVNGIRYTIHPNSFFQTNSDMAGKLQTAVLDLLPSGKILDLYCGLGFFGIAAAKKGNEVYGHELDTPAIELAKRNAADNGVADKTRWGAGPVEALDWSAEKPDAVIIDPPRAGLHPKALKALLENEPPQIIYVSCNFHRLAEELKQLKTKYRVESLQALDLFPHTPHVEVVAKLVYSNT